MRRFFLALIALAGSTLLHATDVPTLRVGVHDKPPYATKSADGQWEGLSVDLWRAMADVDGIAFEFVEMNYDDIIPAVRDGRLDAGVGEMQVTADNQRGLVFTQPFLQTSTGIAVRADTWHPDWNGLARDFFSWTLVSVLASIFVGMVIVSALIWFLERKHHVGHFKGGLKGFGSALWFAAVTMTTVGYGDKTPSTFAGRLIAFAWMLAGVLLIAGFTAAVSSSVATARFNDGVSSMSQLQNTACGVMIATLSQNVLRERGIPTRAFPSLEDALVALEKREIGAVAGDRISLAYLSREFAAHTPPQKIALSPLTIQTSFIGIPVRPGLPQYEAINLALLKVTASPEWQNILTRWLGSHSSKL